MYHVSQKQSKVITSPLRFQKQQLLISSSSFSPLFHQQKYAPPPCVSSGRGGSVLQFLRSFLCAKHSSRPLLRKRALLSYLTVPNCATCYRSRRACLLPSTRMFFSLFFSTLFSLVLLCAKYLIRSLLVMSVKPKAKQRSKKLFDKSQQKLYQP